MTNSAGAEGREELGGCSEGREIYGCRNTSKSVPPFCHCHFRVCFLISSEVGSLGSGRAGRLLGRSGRAGRLLGRSGRAGRLLGRLLICSGFKNA